MRLIGPYVLGLNLLSAGIAVAGGWSSGGGNGIICFDPSETKLADEVRSEKSVADNLVPKIKSIETLDLYLASREAAAEHSSFTPIEMNPGETIDKYIDRIVGYYGDSVPLLKTLISASRKIAHYWPNSGPLPLEGDSVTVKAPTLASFKAASSNLPSAPLFGFAPIYDGQDNLKGYIAYPNPELVIKMPSNCGVVTLSRAYVEDDLDAEKDKAVFGLFAYDTRLFSHPNHPRTSQGTLMLHELLYLQAMLRDQPDSTGTHEVVTSLIRKEGRLSPSELNQLLIKTGFAEPVAKDLLEPPSEE